MVVDLKPYKLGVSVVQKRDGTCGSCVLCWSCTPRRCGITAGTTLYITRDLGAALGRFIKYDFDRMIYVVAGAQVCHGNALACSDRQTAFDRAATVVQDLHFKQLFKMMELMEYPFASKIEHVNFGLVKGMSTRKVRPSVVPYRICMCLCVWCVGLQGNVVFLADILAEAKKAMLEQMEKV